MHLKFKLTPHTLRMIKYYYIVKLCFFGLLSLAITLFNHFGTWKFNKLNGFTQTCIRRSSFDEKGDHSRIVFKLEDQSSWEPFTIGSAQCPEISKSIYNTVQTESKKTSLLGRLRWMQRAVEATSIVKTENITIGTITSSWLVIRRKV